MNRFSFSAAAADGTPFPLPAPSSFSVSFDEDSPAHSLEAVFPLDAPPPPLHSCVLSFDGQVILSALIDQQSFSVSKNGASFRFAARSRTALLLDNQAAPQTYLNPSLKQLFDRHAAPFGFTEVKGNLGPFYGKFVVKKGMSQWKVLSDFCAYFLGVTLRPLGDRSLDASGDVSERRVSFSNRGDGIPFSSLEHNFLFQNQLSHLYIQSALGAPYSGPITDQDAVNLGVSRSKYLSLCPFLAKRSLLKSRRNAQEIVISSPLPLLHLLSLGDLASVSDPSLGSFDGFSVAKISFSLSAGSACSRVTLRPLVDL